MKNIKPYQGDALTLYDEIVEAKRGDAERHATLQRLRPLIAQLYKTYERSRANLEGLSPRGSFTRDERRALLHCYDVETAPLARMKHAVLDALPREIGDKCPYCGIDSTGATDGGSAGSWDHYLPKRSRDSVMAGFAEFSAHPFNLIPCCAPCNGRKSDKWRNSGTQRKFIYPYNDVIDQTTPLLEARIMVHTNEPAVEFYVNMPSYKAASSLFKRHCKGLDLPSRYARASRAELVRMHMQIRKRAPRHDADWFLMDLQETAEVDAELFGINHWKPTLYRAAARSRDFVLHCLQSAGSPGAAANNVTSAAGGGQRS